MLPTSMNQGRSKNSGQSFNSLWKNTKRAKINAAKKLYNVNDPDQDDKSNRECKLAQDLFNHQIRNLTSDIGGLLNE